MYETTDIEDNEHSSELKSEAGTMPKVEVLGYDELASEHIHLRNIGDNVASSSGSNVRSSLLGMGFSPSLVDKAIIQNGEDNFDILLETLFAYTALKTSKPGYSDSANSSIYEKENVLSGDSLRREALHRSHSESSDSLDSLFGDEKDTSSQANDPTVIHLKEELDEDFDVVADKKASLLMMNFTMDEADFAFDKLGTDVPLSELVDFILAAQMAGADDLQIIHERKVEEVSTETLFGTMDKTLRLLEVGFSEQEISAAIEKYGSEVSIQELADSIVDDRTAGTCIKTEPYSFTSNSNSSMAGSKFKSSSGGAVAVINPSFYSNLAIKTEEEHNRPVASQNKELDIMEKLKGKMPNEDYVIDIPNSLKRPKPEIDDDLKSCSELAFPPEQREGISKLLRRQLNHKARRRESCGVPKLVKPSSCRSVDQMVAKAPLFFYGNVMNLSQDCWVKISQFLYAIEPEFVNTQFFSALSRNEGYLHNLPSENRFHIMPKSPMTIEEVMPHTKKHWPLWDTRKQLSCISSETIGVPQLCDRLRKVLVDSRGLLSAEQQKDLLHQCKTLNLMWVGHNRLAPIEPESVERILGYPVNHTQADGFSSAERLQSLKYSFQTDTLGYHLSVLKTMFPEGLTMLSIYSGVGGAEITLHRLGIHFKGLVSVEPSETKRKILKKWWQDSGQMGELVQVEDIQKLSSSRIESLMKKFGVFDFIICQNPYTQSPKSCPMVAADAEVVMGLDFSLFYEFVRVLQRVRSAIGTR